MTLSQSLMTFMSTSTHYSNIIMDDITGLNSTLEGQVKVCTVIHLFCGIWIVIILDKKKNSNHLVEYTAHQVPLPWSCRQKWEIYWILKIFENVNDSLPHESYEEKISVPMERSLAEWKRQYRDLKRKLPGFLRWTLMVYGI